MKKIILFVYVLFIQSVLSQTIVYTTDGVNLVNELEINQQKNKLISKFSKLFKKKMYAELKNRSTEKRNDSIIHFITFDLKDSKSKKSKIENLIGDEFLDFKFKDITGKVISLQSLKGKPTLINFWFTKCQPCIDEMPHLNKLKNKYKKSMNFISMTYENKAAVKKFLSKREFNFNHITNLKGYTDRLELESFPVNVFLDKNLIIREVESGLPYEKVNGKMAIKDASDFEEIIKNLNVE
jgi:thiol-disulfide isomerase/thioredoxin